MTAGAKIVDGLKEAIAVARGEIEPARETHFHYVRFADIPRFQAVGWSLTEGNLGPTHGRWSALMRWDGSGEPVEPEGV